MPQLDELIPAPRLVEVDHVDVAGPPAQVWEHVRHADLARSPMIHALFELRALPERLTGHHRPSSLRLDDLRSTPEAPGFQLLLEDEFHGFAVGAIGKVWRSQIPFVHVGDASAFAGFVAPGFVKVAWAIRLLPLGEHDTRVELEVRVDATDEPAWRKFKRYFVLIGPGSHFIRRVLLSDLARELGRPEQAAQARGLAGDELLPDARAEATDSITIGAPAERIWPWLVQMGCQRAGYYAVDWLDNGGVRSSREVVPKLQGLAVGQIIPASPDSNEGFEVLRLEEPHLLVLGGLYDAKLAFQLPFGSTRPERFWQVTWAFVLERLDEKSTRLHVRARAAFPSSGRGHALWIGPVHHFMQRRMLHNLAARAEGRQPRDDYREVLSGLGGATVMLASLLTPFLRQRRNHWGVSEAEARATRPGDELVPTPTWSWTHAVEVGVAPEKVWPWVAQIGADRAGFYSYQWLENLVGCGISNAEAVHPEWELKLGDSLLLHPKLPALRIAQLERGVYFVAHAPLDPAEPAQGRPWATASWLFALEPLPEGRCRILTRYRVACSEDLATRLSMGPALLEPIGFAMDRRMLLRLKAHAEREARYALSRDVVGPSAHV